ncbi:LacI family DNA-binding transcriptional regulator [Alkalihalobacillus sp. MEB130]|uniref:LacI family DNA-binding transcriptional regulator n=1 Tax=Alkalihalobacillus sp. MEB130 TaxID=2976704 RepID=UPI0028DF2663|nr:LacI family DNA-binding transcriptional regulator [Alkalihalobacillus sp. MEB130]MDT8862614.1 LacI family DNA-binding transcriptional regulator [Alkalihalobacillus sp. MEB130]
MPITIKDVARVANVTPSTVSRVIADNPRISQKTKEKVREVMQELGYQPNFKARSLVNRSTQTIGLVMPNSTDKVFQNPFFPEVIRGISKFAHTMEYALHISTGETEEEIYDGTVKMVQSGRVDGVILLYSRKNDKVTNFLLEKDFPFVLVGKPYDHPELITYVDNDNAKATYDVTSYFIRLGHERIGFVGGNRDLIVTVDRQRGFESAIREAGLTIQEEYIVYEEFMKEGGHQAIAELLSLPNPPSALVVSDDLMALGMIHTLDEMGVRVPEDISIISFNNLLLAEMSRPPLTSVDINIYQLGYESARCLIEKIQQPDIPPNRVTVPYNIIKRSSCKALKG